jgi:hypothetical protein
VRIFVTQAAQSDDAPHDPPERGAARTGTGQVFSQGKGQDDADEKQEQGKNQVIELESLPLNVVKLFGEVLAIGRASIVPNSEGGSDLRR